ncbi:hypothetical protein COLO4_18727 [Corchorus olitorius]|uniref:Uncharacterized protein n=1 Tax=Corchorus olitorius TaxID=93759 RepID=A0A1R3J852_9ROSI|nr:hypothetical protein COLO4_18727 [Corchorus olitorius]
MGNQAQFKEASSEGGAAASATASRHSILLTLKEFITNFEKEKKSPSKTPNSWWKRWNRREV